MKNIYLRLLFILLILFFIFKLWSYNDDSKCLENVKTKIVTNIKADEIIDFSKEIDCFEWDKIMFTDPHFSASYIEKHTKININGFRLMGFKSFYSSDFYSFMIFLNKKEVVGFIDISSGIISENLLDGMKNKDLTLIDKNDAKFQLYEIKGNYRLDGDKIYSIRFINKNDSIKYSR